MFAKRQIPVLCAAAVFGLAGLAVCHGQVSREKPRVAQGIQVEQQLGKTVTLEAKFHDDRNHYLALGDFFDGKRPVILSFNFSNCPRLCVVQFNNLVSALLSLDLVPGRDFQIVSISLDPRDKPTDAYDTKQNYLVSYGRMDTADGWHFLVGNEATIEQAADRCGIRYEYIPEQDSFSHPSAFIFCSGQGQIIRYLNGLDGDLKQKLKPAIIEAGEGRVGGLMDRMLYFASCYEFDATTGRYTLAARNLMKWGGAATVIALVVALVPYWLGRRRSRANKNSGGGPSSPLFRKAPATPGEVSS